MIPEVGKRYHVYHSRKGQFDMDVQRVNQSKDEDWWVSGPIIAGRAYYISRLNEREGEVGDHITVRASLAKFEEIT